MGDLVLLPDAGLVLKPELYVFALGLLGCDLCQLGSMLPCLFSGVVDMTALDHKRTLGRHTLNDRKWHIGDVLARTRDVGEAPESGLTACRVVTTIYEYTA